MCVCGMVKILTLLVEFGESLAFRGASIPDKPVSNRGVGTGGAQGARAPPKFLPRPKSALFRDEKCALFAEANVAVKTTIF